MTDAVQRYEIQGRLATLKTAFDELLGRIAEKPDRLEGLTDSELLALAAWTGEGNGDSAVQAECRRRAERYGEQARRFEGFGGPDPWAAVPAADPRVLAALAEDEDAPAS